MTRIDPNQIERLRVLCEQIGQIDEKELRDTAVAMNEDMTLHADIRSLALDAMLIAQGDFNGEFESRAELLSAVEKLKEAE